MIQNKIRKNLCKEIIRCWKEIIPKKAFSDDYHLISSSFSLKWPLPWLIDHDLGRKWTLKRRWWWWWSGQYRISNNNNNMVWWHCVASYKLKSVSYVFSLTNYLHILSCWGFPPDIVSSTPHARKCKHGRSLTVMPALNNNGWGV